MSVTRRWRSHFYTGVDSFLQLTLIVALSCLGMVSTGCQSHALHVESITFDPTGVKTYQVKSNYLGDARVTLRMLSPDQPASDISSRHDDEAPPRLLYILPVEKDGSSMWGDGFELARELNIHNRFNMTLVAPGFPIDPWYADHETRKDLRLESYLVRHVVPFVDAQVAQRGESPRRLLIGFSKSGCGAFSLILRHDDLFDAAAAWDAPLMVDDLRFNMAANYGSAKHFQDHYQIDRLLLIHQDAFQQRNRLWIGGGPGNAHQAHLPRIVSLMTEHRIQHTFDNDLALRHRWDTGWFERAVMFLNEVSKIRRDGRLR